MAQGANSALLSEEAQQLPLPNERKPKIILDERGLLDVPFLVLTVLLVTIGVIMMFSASYARAYEVKGNSTYYFARQAIFAVVGIGMMLFVSRINYQIWRGASLLVLLAAVFFLLLVPVIGTTENGAKRWLNLGFMSFQPSELAKPAIILSFASLMSTYREKMQTFRYGVLPFAAILIVICGLLMLEPHFSGIIIMLVIGATMMFLGGVQVRWFVIGGALFEHGERFYNFKGLRAFKEKFRPDWEPRYLAVAGTATPMVALMDATLLIGGGLKGVIGR